MSDKREVQNKPLIILRNAEDYPTWKSYTISRLQQESCDWAVSGRAPPNLESVRAALIEDGFAAADLRPATLIPALRDEKKNYLVGLAKCVDLIKELVDKSLHPLLSDKNAAEMWTILENTFQHISPISVTRIFLDACSVRLADCNDVIDYTSRYQIAFDKLLSLLNNDSWMSKKTIEMTLQGSLLRHLGKDYAALVSAMETTWKDETTDLADTIFRVIRHAEINKGNGKDNADVKVLAANIHRAPKGTCTTKKCVERGVTTHYTDRCWVLHLELRAKYSLRQMRPRGSNRNLKKANTPTESVEKSEETAAPEINS